MVQTRDESRNRQNTEPGQSARGKTDIQQPTSVEKESGSLSRRQQPALGNWRDPFSLMHAFRHEMDRMFDNFGLSSMTAPFGGSTTTGSQFAPQIELYEKDGKLHVCADLPGLNKNDVKVELNDNLLTIEGERRSEQKDEKEGWSERSYGHFLRSVTLPEGVNGENARANFKDGVLDITLDAPKVEEKKGRKIEIA